MGHDLTQKLYKEIKKRGMTVKEAAKALDIPASRIYAWRKENTGPKTEDSRKINDWILGKLENPLSNSDADLEELDYGAEMFALYNDLFRVVIDELGISARRRADEVLRAHRLGHMIYNRGIRNISGEE